MPCIPCTWKGHWPSAARILPELHQKKIVVADDGPGSDGAPGKNTPPELRERSQFAREGVVPPPVFDSVHRDRPPGSLKPQPHLTRASGIGIQFMPLCSHTDMLLKERGPFCDRHCDRNELVGGLVYDAILLRWFNHWLKDAGEFGGEPRIRYFALGPNEWRSAEEWPVEASFALFLRSGGKANSRKGDGRLATEAAEGDEARDVFVYDPEVPVLAPGGPQALSGPFDQAALEIGNNLLVYTTEPAVREMEVLGQARVRLYAATSAAHADFTSKIVRVTADGKAEFLSIGIARSSWLFRDEGYAADEVHAWEFALEPIAFVLATGERLRLEIASSAFPLYDRNPSTDALPQLADNFNWARSTQQVLHSAEYPSVLYLPVKGEAGW